ncbi:type II secretion system protein [bacterium]|nr:type II secretion system protein [bacterium]
MTNKHAINNSKHSTNNSLLTNFAFTLAETLIVMGIIGVVAALTLPNLNSSTGDKEKVAKLQKIYSNLNDSFSRAEAVYGPFANWCTGISDADLCATKTMTRVIDFLKISKDCGYSAQTGKSGNGCFELSNQGFVVNSGYTVILADGASIKSENGLDTACSDSTLSSVASNVPEKCILGFIDVDIDGPNKGPNTAGKDIFSYSLTEQGIVPSGSENELTDSDLKSSCFYKGSNAPICTVWVLKSGNMDYLKATNGTCPNGTVLSWTNITCK